MASEMVTATEENCDELFEGVMITVQDFGGPYRVPGWECRVCGWRVGAQGLPPRHICPDAGKRQRQRALDFKAKEPTND